MKKFLLLFSIKLARRHAFLLLLTSLIIAFGAAGFLGVRMITQSLQTSVQAGARDSLGGDLSMSLSRLISNDSLEHLLSGTLLEGLPRARITQALSMASAKIESTAGFMDSSEQARSETATLVEVIAVDSSFPLLPGFTTLPHDAINNLSSGEAIVDRSLIRSLWNHELDAQKDPETQVQALSAGPELLLGDLRFKIIGFIQEDPTRQPSSLVTGPRVYVRRQEDLLKALFQDKSRVQDRVVYLNKAEAPVAPTIREPLPSSLLARVASEGLKNLDGLQIRSAQDHARRIFRPLRRFTLIVEIAGFASLMLALFGAAFSMRQITSLFTGQVALLKALGARDSLTPLPALLLCASTLILGLVFGSFLAVFAGYFLSTLMNSGLLENSQAIATLQSGQSAAYSLHGFADWLRIVFSDAAQLRELGFLWLLAIFVVTLQVAPFLRELRASQPLLLLEHQQELATNNQNLSQLRSKKQAGKKHEGAIKNFVLRNASLAATLLAALLSGLWILGEIKLVLAMLAGVTLVYAAGLGITSLLFAVAARIEKFVPCELQVVIKSTLRGRGKYGIFVSTLSFSLCLAFFIQFVSNDFLQNVLETSKDRPNAFFIDVQNSQKDSFSTAVTAAFGKAPQSQALVRARLVSVAGKSVAELLASMSKEEARAKPLEEDSEVDGRKRRYLERELNLSYLAKLDEKTITAGSPWPEFNEMALKSGVQGERPEVSLETGYAEALGIGVGDFLTIDIQGIELELRVTSLRKVDWSSGQINFFAVAHPSTLLAAPQQHIFATHLDEKQGLEQVNKLLKEKFPNVTLFDVRAIALKLEAVLKGMSQAILLISWLCLISAFLTFSGTLVHLRYLRLKDISLLRLLGARSIRIRLGFVLEFLILTVASSGAALFLSVILFAGTSYVLAGSVTLVAFGALRGVFALVVISNALGTAIGYFSSIRSLQLQPIEALRESEDLAL